MIQWYGTGGDWINEGLPHYVGIDCKPKNGCEIQNTACGKTGIMMELHVVKGPVEERSALENDDDDNWGMAARSCCTCCSIGPVPNATLHALILTFLCPSSLLSL
jgi:hypothetical protein